MNVTDHGKIISKISVDILKESIEKIHKVNKPDSKWFQYGKRPKNNIEKYILESYNKIIKDTHNLNVLGFEWWVHDSESISTISFHFDCDEYLRWNYGRIITPSLSTITYLTDNLSPTVITNIKTVGENLDDYNPKIPTEIVYSFPGTGKFLTFDSKYYHGVLNTDHEKRLTLLYNVWSYCPNELIKIEVFERLANIDIDSNIKQIKKYEGNYEFYSCEIFEEEFFLPLLIDVGKSNTYYVG
jgi:hypothetical protein